MPNINFALHDGQSDDPTLATTPDNSIDQECVLCMVTGMLGNGNVEELCCISTCQSQRIKAG